MRPRHKTNHQWDWFKNIFKSIFEPISILYFPGYLNTSWKSPQFETIWHPDIIDNDINWLKLKNQHESSINWKIVQNNFEKKKAIGNKGKGVLLPTRQYPSFRRTEMGNKMQIWESCSKQTGICCFFTFYFILFISDLNKLYFLFLRSQRHRPIIFCFLF